MSEHERMSSLAPWFANGTLVGDERLRFERHLETCDDCQEEVVLCRELAATYPADDGPAPHPARVARLLDRIEAGAAESLPAGPPPRLEWLRVLARATPRPARWLIAAQAAMLLLAGGATLVRDTDETGRPAFRTLSSAAPPTAGSVRVVFVATAQESEIRQLLLGVRAEIVGGPSPVGAYSLALDDSPAGGPLAEALELLRASPLVRLAEPISGSREARD